VWISRVSLSAYYIALLLVSAFCDVVKTVYSFSLQWPKTE
jgi:hypothetical protein